MLPAVKVDSAWVASARTTRVGDPAPHTGAVIGYNALTEPYYSARFAGGRRLTG